MKIVFRCDPAMLDSLARPRHARQALPKWLRTMPRTAFWETHGLDVRTVKQCPPFVDAMSHGFIIPLPCDVNVSDGVLSWIGIIRPFRSGLIRARRSAFMSRRRQPERRFSAPTSPS